MSSIEDLAKWDRNFYTREVGGDFLHRELHRRAVLANGDTISYAGGLTVDQYRGLRTVRHGGSTAGYRTEILRFPEQRVSAIVLCNVSAAVPTTYTNRIAEIWLGDALTPRVAGTEAPAAGSTESGAPARDRAVPPRLTAAELAAYVGDYVSEEVRSTWGVVARGDTLLLRHEVLGDRVLRPLEHDRFATGGMSIRFTRTGTRVTAMTIEQGRVRALRFMRR